jgi:glutathione S-transferase
VKGIEIWHWEPVGACAAALICLHEKGIPFTGHYVDVLAFGQFRPDFIALNPAAQVPVLLHEGEAITESTLLNEYLDEAFPSPRLAPEDAKGWYDTLSWGKYLDYHLAPSVATLGWQEVTLPFLREAGALPQREACDAIPVPERRAAWLAAIEGCSEDQIADSRRKIELAARRMEETLRAQDWLLGGAFSIVDIDAFALARTLPELVPGIVNDAATPRVMDWLKRIGARPAVQAALAMRRAERDLYAPGPEHSRWG